MKKIKFVTPNGVEVEGTVLTTVEEVTIAYAQNRIVKITPTDVEILVEYASIPELDCQ